MANNKVKKSFKKFAKKHLAGVIETRRKTAKSKKEKLERIERKKVRQVKEAAREEKEHVDHLDRLKDTDPEFYSYLEEEDPTLLQFGTDDVDIVDENEGSDAETEVDEDEDRDDEEEEDDEEEDDEEGEEGSGERRTASKKSVRVTKQELDALLTQNKMENLIDIFVSAVRELGYKLKENPKASSTRKFDEPSLVKHALLAVAQHTSKNLDKLVSGKGAFRSHKTRYLVKRLLHALTSVVGEGIVDTALTAGLMQSLTPFVPLLHYVKGTTKLVLKAALTLCTAPEEPVRVAAYVVVRTIATRATGTRSMYQSTAFKGIFLALVRTAHQYNVHNQSIVAFLMNCTVDLYGTDMEAAYQHTFVYLRQLAIYLRAALQQQTQSNVRAVVNWQYLIALRTWGAVVSTYSEPSQLGPLIHPIVQIATSLMDLFSSPRMFPMHLQIIEVLNHISSRADGVYIPVAPYLLRIITSPSVALSGAPNASASNEAVDLPLTIRVKKNQAKSNAYHRAVWTEALYLLTEHMATHSHTIGFPESFWAVDSTLKSLRTDVKVPKIHSQISNLLRNMQGTSQKIIARRDQANFGPCDLSAVKQFEDEMKQQGSPLVSLHHSLRQQRVDTFAARQKSLVEDRVTLESAVKKGNGKGKGKGNKRARAE